MRRGPGELVLIHYQEQPAVYARIEAVEPDIKKDWFRVTLLLLTIPAQEVTWILRESYVDGAEFTMGGRPVRLAEVPRPAAVEPDRDREPPREGEKGRVIPFRPPKA